ncbi:DUF3618 domain-containing protein [uncultured Jatrophihabitans sp.]|uniref:DUF3618 domain-containing protein n=1 Tax=uncultured Jatrophihabitans sp. TaxID=1610747 RepID=UPI0035C96F95
MTTPDEIQQEIERTRAQLSGDVDRLNEKVSPSKVVGRRVDSVKTSAASLREKVMGSAQGANGNLGSGVSNAQSALQDKASSLSSAASNAPQAVKSQAQGNPLAVGLIAFGVGWLVSSLAPASQAEQQVAAQAEAKAKQLAEPAKQVGQEIAQNLKEPVQQSVEQVKTAATDAAQDTADQARHAADDVKQPLQQ